MTIAQMAPEPITYWFNGGGVNSSSALSNYKEVGANHGIHKPIATAMGKERP